MTWLEEFREHLMTTDPKAENKTHMFEILRILRSIPEVAQTITNKTTHYDNDGLVWRFSFIDGKEYMLRITEDK